MGVIVDCLSSKVPHAIGQGFISCLNGPCRDVNTWNTQLHDYTDIHMWAQDSLNYRPNKNYHVNLTLSKHLTLKN